MLKAIAMSIASAMGMAVRLSIFVDSVDFDVYLCKKVRTANCTFVQLKQETMKNNIRTIAAAVILNLVAFNAWSQNEVAVLTPGNETIVSEKPAAPTVVNKEVQILLKNSAEKSVAVFAGPKEEIKDPKLKVVG